MLQSTHTAFITYNIYEIVFFITSALLRSHIVVMPQILRCQRHRGEVLIYTLKRRKNVKGSGCKKINENATELQY